MKILFSQIKTTFHFWFLTYSQLMSYGQARMRVASKVWRKNILDTKTGFTWLHGFNCHGSLVWSHGIQLIKRLDGTIGNSSHLSIIHFTFPPSKVNRSPYWSISIGICSNSEIHEWSLQIKPYILFGFYFLGGGLYNCAFYQNWR